MSLPPRACALVCRTLGSLRHEPSPHEESARQTGGTVMWNQVYDPFSNQPLSTIAAALPVVTLLVLIASNKVKAHLAALAALVVANLVAIYIFTMPASMSLRATVLGAVTGFFPIGWIVLNVIFLYRLTVEKGVFETLQTTIGS